MWNNNYLCESNSGSTPDRIWHCNFGQWHGHGHRDDGLVGINYLFLRRLGYNDLYEFGKGYMGELNLNHRHRHRDGRDKLPLRGVLMIGIGSVMKLARGGIGADELAEILASAGIGLSFEEKPVAVSTFQSLGATASLPGSKIIEIRGQMKGGDTVHALMVVNQGG
jgi:hypothetical protein